MLSQHTRKSKFMGLFNLPMTFKEYISARAKFKQGMELEIWSNNFVINTSYSLNNFRLIMEGICMELPERFKQKRLRKGSLKRVLAKTNFRTNNQPPCRIKEKKVKRSIDSIPITILYFINNCDI